MPDYSAKPKTITQRQFVQVTCSKQTYYHTYPHLLDGPMLRHPLIIALVRPRPFLVFGTQTPPQFILNTIKVALFTHLIWEHFCFVAAVSGPSMLPTINIAGDWIVHSRLHSRGRGCKVGDLVSVVHPEEPEIHVLKRIMGMPGDFVCVNPDPDGLGRDRMLRVPEGHVWLVGDNLPHSRDSRAYGPVPMGLLRGKAIGRIWPQMKLFGDPFKPVDE